jgi:hypothetical protein
VTLPSKLESGVIAFGRVRRWLVAGVGLFVGIEGVISRQWLGLGLGALIVAYGMFAPT